MNKIPKLRPMTKRAITRCQGMLTQHTRLVNRIALMFLPIGLFAFSCEDNSLPENCLPYEGELYGISCSGIIIKVTNKDIDSYMDTGNDIVRNVLTATPSPNLPNLPLDSLVGKKLYFDYRAPKPEEKNPHPCNQDLHDTNLLVYVTKFSFTQCSHSPMK